MRRTREIAAGQRIWEDIDAFVTMLADVNQRQELREHDSRLVHESLGRVLLAPTAPLTAELIEQLKRLEGLDDEVDALLHGGSKEVAAWRPLLERLARELIGSREGVTFS